MLTACEGPMEAAIALNPDRLPRNGRIREKPFGEDGAQPRGAINLPHNAIRKSQVYRVLRFNAKFALPAAL